LLQKALIASIASLAALAVTNRIAIPCVHPSLLWPATADMYQSAKPAPICLQDLAEVVEYQVMQAKAQRAREKQKQDFQADSGFIF
jgi:hypothetical protein